MIGPPCAPVMSMMRSVALPAVQARVPMCRSVRLLDCQSPGRSASLKSPLKRLPPSRGIMFSRTPPAAVSAPMPLVW